MAGPLEKVLQCKTDDDVCGARDPELSELISKLQGKDNACMCSV